MDVDSAAKKIQDSSTLTDNAARCWMLLEHAVRVDMSMNVVSVMVPEHRANQRSTSMSNSPENRIWRVAAMSWAV